MAIGRRAVGEGENELLARRALLATLAQTETAVLVLAQGGDYLVALGVCRPEVLLEVAAFVAEPPEALSVFETTDAEHGRPELRRHWVNDNLERLFSDRRHAGG